MFSFDQLHTPSPGNQTPTQGTETPTSYIAAPDNPDRYGPHQGVLPQAGQFASANNQTYEDAPHDAPEEFLQGSSRQSDNLNRLYLGYNPNWSVDQMIAWLSGVEDVDTAGVPSKPDAEPAAAGHSVLHELGQETHDTGVIPPGDALQERAAPDVAPPIVPEVTPVDDEVPQEKAKASRGGYGMACQTCKEDKTRCEWDIDGEPCKHCRKYMRVKPTHVCAKQVDVGTRGRPKGVLNGQGKNSAKKKGAGLVRPEERKKKQEGVKEAAHAQTQGGKGKEKA
ncbi:hypothetical protein OBBRIDRAFT_891829 [Obba rivulosa]|uniref:Zn(2)-C6 fungal-type domain-containing protein n=1 Tax=Obba rivulosa TaxID=1052685 RepID=A0A8E2AH33_9APHY|nr:hypothetical protein OBBRIDRAFT_891829 [Obba rivulosa]